MLISIKQTVILHLVHDFFVFFFIIKYLLQRLIDIIVSVDGFAFWDEQIVVKFELK